MPAIMPAVLSCLLCSVSLLCLVMLAVLSHACCAWSMLCQAATPHPSPLGHVPVRCRGVFEPALEEGVGREVALLRYNPWVKPRIHAPRNHAKGIHIGGTGGLRHGMAGRGGREGRAEGVVRAGEGSARWEIKKKDPPTPVCVPPPQVRCRRESPCECQRYESWGGGEGGKREEW